jgi:peroxidase
VLVNLQKVFGTVDDVDLFIGGLAEYHAPGVMVGETFQRIIAQQFENLRDGDSSHILAQQC